MCPVCPLVKTALIHSVSRLPYLCCTAFENEDTELVAVTVSNLNRFSRFLLPYFLVKFAVLKIRRSMALCGWEGNRGRRGRDGEEWQLGTYVHHLVSRECLLRNRRSP